MRVNFIPRIRYSIVSFTPFAKGETKVPDELIHEYYSSWERFWKAHKSLVKYEQEQFDREESEKIRKEVGCQGKIRRSGSLVTHQDVARESSSSRAGCTNGNSQGATSAG